MKRMSSCHIDRNGNLITIEALAFSGRQVSESTANRSRLQKSLIGTSIMNITITETLKEGWNSEEARDRGGIVNQITFSWLLEFHDPDAVWPEVCSAFTMAPGMGMDGSCD